MRRASGTITVNRDAVLALTAILTAYLLYAKLSGIKADTSAMRREITPTPPLGPRPPHPDRSDRTDDGDGGDDGRDSITIDASDPDTEGGA